MYSPDNIKRIEDFQKYAGFVCEHFDIEVQLDSTKAQTDGKVITLPNVSGMSDEELDMMYTILLHEAGHIKFSLFNEEAFAKLKTKAHAYLANSIEDARIENLLMKEFGGATAMFEKLYCDYAVNRKLMKKVFNIEGKRIDLFNSLALYLHSYLIDCKTAPFSRVVSRDNYIKVKLFIKKYKIEEFLDQAPLNNWDDVIAITNKVYDLFVKEFQDTSEKCTFEADLKLKKEVEKALEAIQKEIKDCQEQMKEVEESISKQENKIQEWEEKNLQNLQEKERTHSKLQEDLSDIGNVLKQRYSIEKSQKQFDSESEKIKNQNSKIEKLTQEVNELTEKNSNGLNGRGKPFTESQLEKAQKSLETKSNQLKSAQEKLKAMNEQFKKIEQEVEQNKLKSEAKKFENVSNDALNEQKQKLIEESNASSEEINKLNSELQGMTNELQGLQSQIQNKVSELQSKIMKNMYELDQKGLAQEFPVDVLPEFEETPGWEAADQAQQKFDKYASEQRKEVIRNGGRLAGLIGSNLRDLSVYIDKTIQKVENINLLDIFEKKAGVSRFPQLNTGDHAVSTKTSTDTSIRSDWSSIDKHTTLTTQFDIVKNDNIAQDKKIAPQLMLANAPFIRELKSTFMNKFKFSKKDYFRGGKEEGQLDNRNLWKLPTKQGDDYFEVNSPKFVNKVAASILIDISGSQDKEETDYGKKLQVLALALSESLKGVHAKHEILGFHAPVSDDMREAQAAASYNRRSNKLETIVYKTFSQKENNGITNLDIQASDNSDGESIRIAIKRLKKENAKSKVLFIITDGKPFLSDADVTILDEDLKLALREAVRNKVQVFALGFAPNGKDFYGERFCYIQDYNDVIKFVQKMNI